MDHPRSLTRTGLDLKPRRGVLGKVDVGKVEFTTFEVERSLSPVFGTSIRIE